MDKEERERLDGLREGIDRRIANREGNEIQLIRNITDNLESLEELLRRCSSRWGYEDQIYRFYHQSLKVYRIQETTQEIVARLESLAPELPLQKWFVEIVQQGTGKEFELEHNDRWTELTRPMLEAFFHARFFLEMICKYGKEIKEPPSSLPSGWAAVLYLYNLR